MIVSVCILIGTALGSCLGVYLILRKLRTALATWLFLGLLWIAAVSCILLVDVNVPLEDSHYRTVGNTPAQAWAAVLAMAFRFAAIAAVALGQSQLRLVAQPSIARRTRSG